MSINEFRNRIVDVLLPEFCGDSKRRYDPVGFKCDFSAIKEIDAINFIRGMDAGLLKLVGRMYFASQSRAGEQFFWEGQRSIVPRPITLWLEPIICVATLSVLHFEHQWPKQALGTQSSDWAFDVTAYVDNNVENEYIACEVKKTIKEIDRLIVLMRKFGLSPLCKAKNRIEENAYKKVAALRSRRASIFWAVGPGGYGAVMRMAYPGDDRVMFEETTIAELQYPAAS